VLTAADVRVLQSYFVDKYFLACPSIDASKVAAPFGNFTVTGTMCSVATDGDVCTLACAAGFDVVAGSGQ
jgi:hypothetical protein